MKEKELERLKEIKKIEEELYSQGTISIAGIDEAGRGPLAGPVVVACVVMPRDSMIEGVNDSKKVSEKKREKLYEEIIKEAIPAAARRKGGHPAKRTFQALRIAVNDELNVFDRALKDALDLLNSKGRISVITFHSLEDKICKYTFNDVTKLKDVPPGLPVIPEHLLPKYKLINKKAIVASDEELEMNHRAHSAKLRIIERV